MGNDNLILHSPWADVKEKIKERVLGLTDEDLAYEPGHESALLDRLARKMQRSTAEVKAFIESISYNQDMAS